MTTAPLLITIPVHEEHGWTARSPPADELPVRARLAETQHHKSPTELRLAEERATLLRAAHLDAVKQRAARESSRAIEAHARRLRMEAAARQRAQSRLNEVERQSTNKTCTKRAKQAAERRSQMSEAVLDAREAMSRACAQRGLAELARCHEAQAKREKTLQLTVDRSAYQVKHALAVAAAVKEKEREARKQAGEALTIRLNAAEVRRLDLSPGSSSPPASPTGLTASAKWTGSMSPGGAASRAKLVARTLGEQALLLEQKRLMLSSAQIRAASAHDEAISARVAKAAAVTARAEAVKLARDEKREAAAGAARALHFEKMQDASVRRGLSHLHTKLPCPVFIDATVPKAAGAKPPIGLIARISQRTRKLAASGQSRQQAAKMRRDAIQMRKSLMIKGSALRAVKAAARRAIAVEAVRAKADAAMTRAAEAAAVNLAAISRRAADFNDRVGKAAASRACARSALLVRAKFLSDRAAKASLMVESSRTASSQKLSAKIAAAAESRLKAVQERAAIAMKKSARQHSAAARHTYVLSSRSAAAQIRRMSRDLAAKLTSAAIDDALRVIVDIAGKIPTVNSNSRLEPQDISFEDAVKVSAGPSTPSAENGAPATSM